MRVLKKKLAFKSGLGRLDAKGFVHPCSLLRAFVQGRGDSGKGSSRVLLGSFRLENADVLLDVLWESVSKLEVNLESRTLV